MNCSPFGTLCRIYYSSILLLFFIASCSITEAYNLVQSKSTASGIYRGIVLNSGQYPSFIYGYTSNNNTSLWFTKQGLMFDIHHSIKSETSGKQSEKKYAVSLVFTDNNGNNIVNDIQDIHQVGTIQACKQIPITLLATGGLIHTWDKEVQNGIPFVAPVGENYYHVNAIDGYGCKGKDSVLVTIYEYPEVNFSSDITTGCIPLKIHFEDESAIKSNQVEWIFGTEHSTKTGNASYTFLETGCYTISLSSTLNKCTSTKTKKNHICVIDKPKASFTVSSYTLPLLEPHIELINLSQNGTNYHWNFGDGDTSSLFHTSHTYPGQANIYTIELIVNNGLKNCEDKHTEVITIQDELILYVPNTFTPNGDEHNNEFTPIFSSGFDPNYYLFQVFDRWNILLFESNNSTIGWSGSYHNQPSKSDTYTWIIHYKEKNLQKEHIIKGHVNLIR